VNSSIRKPFLGLLVLTSFLFLVNEAQSSHLRAGEIIATKRSTFQYDFTLILYRNSFQSADQLEAQLDFGDGTKQNVSLSAREELGNFTQKLTYKFSKTYPGAANYTISFTENWRNAGILNISKGSSGETPFYVETQINIDPLLGANTSPQFLSPPIDNGNLNQIYTHSPAAWDANGDSLSFQLITPQSQKGATVPNYVLPSQVPPASGNASFTINPQNGLITWDKPVKEGLYNIAFRVNEWRNGFLIGYVVRDMQINIVFSENINPVLEIPNDTCVIAGINLKDTIVAKFQIGETHKLTAYSGIFSFASPLNIFNATTRQSQKNLTQDSMFFAWQTGCELIRAQPYQVTFKAEDNIGDANSLATTKVWQIKIIPPAFKNLKATPKGRKINLSWDAYSCTNLDSIAILRKECENEASTVTDSCSTGRDIPAGFKILKKVGRTTTSFIDDNAGKGLDYETQYCYYVYAQFPSPQKGYSRASASACMSLTNDFPLIIGASVLKTDSLQGEVEIKWIKPRYIDQALNPPPYQIKVFRNEDINVNTEIVNKNLTDTLGLADTTFIDKNINTKKNLLNYFVQFYANGKLIFTSETASTVKLQGIARNRKAQFQWNFNTPWINDSTYIYRISDNDTLLIDTVAFNVGYVDEPLETGKLYGYFVRTKGAVGCNRSIGLGKVAYPLLNQSQTINITPTDEQNDTLRPCPPTLSILSNGNCDDAGNFSNRLFWKNNLDFLCDSNVAGYRLYKVTNANFSLYINEVLADTVFEGQLNKPVSGCFAVTALNTKSLESKKSNVVCSDSCYYFELPNIFTPNNDNSNDVFTPKPFPRNIEKVVFTVYNRWGAEVFKSESDININWTGNNVPDGLYYFKAEITIGSNSGANEKKNLKGWIVLTR